VTVADLIRVLLELDQQIISPRPSSWGVAAELVHALAEHAEPTLRPGPGPDIFADWDKVDLSQVKRRAPRDLNQPMLDAILSETTHE
jgi:hypothetical protein